MYEQSETINTEIKMIKKVQAEIMELNKTIIALKFSLKEFNNRLKQAEKRIRKLEDRSFEVIVLKTKRKKIKEREPT